MWGFRDAADFVWMIDGLARVFPIFARAKPECAWLDDWIWVRVDFVMKQCALDPAAEKGSKTLFSVSKAVLKWSRVSGQKSCLDKTVERLKRLSSSAPALTETAVQYLRSEGVPIEIDTRTLLQDRLVE